jgi:hypothetical protein
MRYKTRDENARLTAGQYYTRWCGQALGEFDL